MKVSPSDCLSDAYEGTRDGDWNARAVDSDGIDCVFVGTFGGAGIVYAGSGNCVISVTLGSVSDGEK